MSTNAFEATEYIFQVQVGCSARHGKLTLIFPSEGLGGNFIEILIYNQLTLQERTKNHTTLIPTDTMKTHIQK